MGVRLSPQTEPPQASAWGGGTGLDPSARRSWGPKIRLGKVAGGSSESTFQGEKLSTGTIFSLPALVAMDADGHPALGIDPAAVHARGGEGCGHAAFGVQGDASA